MTDEELEALAARLKAILLDMPGDHAPEQLRVAFGMALAMTCAEPDAGLLAFAAAATRVVSATVDARATVEVHICRPGQVTVYEGNGQITPIDVTDMDGRAAVAQRH